ALPIPDVDLDIASLDPAEFRETVPDGGKARCRLPVALGIADNHADPAHALAALGTRCKRRYSRASNGSQEIPPPHRTAPSPTGSQLKLYHAGQPEHRPTQQKGPKIKAFRRCFGL